jgi:hypothetical protein
VEITSAEEEASSNTAPVVVEDVQTLSLSVSSQSRETTPSTAEVVDTPPFITFFQKERQSGKVSSEARAQAISTLREWHAEFLIEDKRVRDLKRKIKAHIAANGETTTTSVTDVRSRGRQSMGRGTVSGTGRGENAGRSENMSRRTTSGEPGGDKHLDPGSEERRASVTGPNGLTGSYWDVPTDEMGRGRRKTKS